MSGLRLAVWFERDAVVAAACFRDDGYFWCQAWPSNGLVDSAIAAAEEWNVSPVSPPPFAGDSLMQPLTWLRCVLPLAGDRPRFDSALSDWGIAGPEQVDEADAVVIRLVASGLNAPATLTTLSWPSLQVSAHTADPDPHMAAEVAEVLRRAEAERERLSEEHRVREAARAAERESERLRAARAKAEALEGAEAAHAAVVAEYANKSLSEHEFVRAVLDGAQQWHLAEWSDALVQAAESTVADPSEISAIHHLLTKTVELRRAAVSPFAGYLEAPTEIIELYQEHGDSLNAVTQHRDDVFEGLIRDVAATFFRRVDQPVRWSDLIDRGAWPIRPEAPEDDYDW